MISGLKNSFNTIAVFSLVFLLFATGFSVVHAQNGDAILGFVVGEGVACEADSDCPLGVCSDGTTYNRFSCVENRCVEIKYFDDPCASHSGPVSVNDTDSEILMDPNYVAEKIVNKGYELLDARIDSDNTAPTFNFRFFTGHSIGIGPMPINGKLWRGIAFNYPPDDSGIAPSKIIILDGPVTKDQTGVRNQEAIADAIDVLSSWLSEKNSNAGLIVEVEKREYTLNILEEDGFYKFMSLMQNFFGPSPDSLKLIQPNSGESWVLGKEEKIAWLDPMAETRETPTFVKIELLGPEACSMPEGGGEPICDRAIYIIAEKAENSGVYVWKVGSVLEDIALPVHNFYRVRITNLNNGEYDESDEPFAIIDRNSINIYSHSKLSGTVGEPFQAGFTATGGEPPYVWAVNSGKLPPGLAFTFPETCVCPVDSDNCLCDSDASVWVQGTPAEAGKYEFSLVAEDSSGLRGEKEFNIFISRESGLRVISPNGGEEWRIGEIKEIRWAFSGPLPPPEPLPVCGDGRCDDSEQKCFEACPACPDGVSPEECGPCYEECLTNCPSDCEATSGEATDIAVPTEQSLVDIYLVPLRVSVPGEPPTPIGGGSAEPIVGGAPGSGGGAAAPVATGRAVACPLDAKICPDGTAVGRVGPDCEFAPCTGETSPGIVCPAVCVPMWHIDGSSCIFNECGSGCGPDGVTTFETKDECLEAVPREPRTPPGNILLDEYTIARNVPNKGEYKWLVGNVLGDVRVPNGAYIVKIVRNGESDTSDSAFYIVDKGAQVPVCRKGSQASETGVESASETSLERRATEGWYIGDRLIRPDNCVCRAVCRGIGTDNEGYYSSCNGELIQLTQCSQDGFFVDDVTEAGEIRGSQIKVKTINEAVETAVSSGRITRVVDVEVEEEDGRNVFKIKGVDRRFFLFVFPYDVDEQFAIDAETGELIG